MSAEGTTPRSRSVRPAVILLGAAVLGVSGGVLLERRQAAKAEAALEAAQDRTPDPQQVRRAEPALPAFPEKATHGLPGYPNATPLSLGENLELSGMPMAIAWFSTQDDPEQVVRYYEKELGENGFPVVSHLYSESAGYAGWYDYFERRMHLVTAVVQGDETLVFISNAEPEKLGMEGGASPSLPGPELDGANVLHVRGEGTTQVLVSGRVVKNSLGSVVGTYRESLLHAGWQIESVEHLAMDRVRLTAREPGRSASVLLTASRPSGDVEVLITLHQG